MEGGVGERASAVLLEVVEGGQGYQFVGHCRLQLVQRRRVMRTLDDTRMHVASWHSPYLVT